MAMDRRNRNRLTQSQVIEFIEFRRRISDTITFINAQNNRLAALLQHCSDFLIGCGNTGLHINHQNGHFCAFDCKLCLTAHLRKDNIIRVWFDTAGINQHNFMVAPFTGRIDSVTGNARSIFHDGKTLTDQLIKQGGFADIWATHHSNYWSDCHRKPHFLL